MLQSLPVSDTIPPPEPAGDVSADVSADVTADANPRAARRLFIVPAIVASVVVLLLAVYFLFGALTRETRSADAYLEDVKTAGGNRRWQAAYELSRLLDSGELEAQQGTAAQAIAVFESARGGSEDPRVRRYLALALGRFGNKAAVPATWGAAKLVPLRGNVEKLSPSVTSTPGARMSGLPRTSVPAAPPVSM